MANRSYLNSQRLKATEADHQKIALLEAENATLKKDKAALEQGVRMPKEAIQKNRGKPLDLCSEAFLFGYTGAYVLFVVAADGTGEHQKEL